MPISKLLRPVEYYFGHDGSHGAARLAQVEHADTFWERVHNASLAGLPASAVAAGMEADTEPKEEFGHHTVEVRRRSCSRSSRLSRVCSRSSQTAQPPHQIAEQLQHWRTRVGTC